VITSTRSFAQVLCPTLLHADGVKHLRGATELNLAGYGLFDRQFAEHEWARSKSQIRIRFLAFQTDACNGLRAPKFLSGDNQVAGKIAENRPGRLKTVV
jgi:hypothetical protein